MNAGRCVLSQVLGLVHWQSLRRLVERYGAETRVRHFGCRQQLICMVFAQLTWREGLRDIETCLNARPEAIYHLGFCQPVARSTLAEANERRDWRMCISHFFGTSSNAVKTQIWIAVSVCLIIAILHKQLKLPGTLHRTLQLLSVHPFEKTPLHELLTESDSHALPTQDNHQSPLFTL